MKGKVIEWYDPKGYGFISTLSHDKKVFIHISMVQNNGLRPRLNDEIKFEISTDSKGRLSAKNAVILNRTSRVLTGNFACFFLVLVCVSPVVFKSLLFLIPLYFSLSFFTYLMFARDKQAAKNNNWRTPENTLHLLSFMGGWPGALLAQNRLHHKTKKQPFKSILWLMIALNIIVFIWILTPTGSESIKALIPSIF